MDVRDWKTIFDLKIVRVLPKSKRFLNVSAQYGFFREPIFYRYIFCTLLRITITFQFNALRIYYVSEEHFFTEKYFPYKNTLVYIQRERESLYRGFNFANYKYSLDFYPVFESVCRSHVENPFQRLIRLLKRV